MNSGNDLEIRSLNLEFFKQTNVSGEVFWFEAVATGRFFVDRFSMRKEMIIFSEISRMVTGPGSFIGVRKLLKSGIFTWRHGHGNFMDIQLFSEPGMKRCVYMCVLYPFWGACLMFAFFVA